MAGRADGFALNQEAMQGSTCLNLNSAPEGLCNKQLHLVSAPGSRALPHSVCQVLITAHMLPAKITYRKKCKILFQFSSKALTPSRGCDCGEQNKTKQNKIGGALKQLNKDTHQTCLTKVLLN